MLEEIKKSIQRHEPKIYGDIKKAAVLLPLLKRDGELQILYEVRSHLVSQAGDSSFPGGRVEEGETFLEAAVRETTEELNLIKEQIKVMGEIDYIVSNQMVIRCFVGELLDVAFEEIQPNVEVAEIYTIPVRYLLKQEPTYFEVSFDPVVDEQFFKNQDQDIQTFEFSEHKQRIPYYEIQNHRLWGYTANLTECFIKIVQKRLGRPPSSTLKH